MKCSYFFLTLITYFSNINYIFFSPVANSAMKNACCIFTEQETRLHFSAFPLEFYIRTFNHNHDHISLMEIDFNGSQNI